MGGDDPLVAGADARRERADREGRGAGRDADAVARTAVRSELLLEAGDLLAEDVGACSQDALEGASEVILDWLLVSGASEAERRPSPIRGEPAPAWRADPSIWMTSDLSNDR